MIEQYWLLLSTLKAYLWRGYMIKLTIRIPNRQTMPIPEMAFNCHLIMQRLGMNADDWVFTETDGDNITMIPKEQQLCAVK